MPLRAIYKPEPRSRRLLRASLPYICTLITSSVALSLSLRIPMMGEKPFYVLFFAATGFCAWQYGLAAGLASAAMNGIAIDYFVLSPTHSFAIDNSDDLIRLLIFGAASILLAIVLAKLNSARQELQRAHERLLLANQVARIVCWELDLASNQIVWSTAAEDERHAHRGDLKTYLERIVPEDQPKVIASLKWAFEGQKRYELEYRVKSQDGRIRWVAASGEFYRTAKGAQRLLGVNVDITTRKQAEEAMQAAAKGEMAGELAHQINSPLQSLIHALYLLRKEASGSTAGQYSAIAQSEAERVSQLVRQILHLYQRPFDIATR